MEAMTSQQTVQISSAPIPPQVYESPIKYFIPLAKVDAADRVVLEDFVKNIMRQLVARSVSRCQVLDILEAKEIHSAVNK